MSAGWTPLISKSDRLLNGHKKGRVLDAAPLLNLIGCGD